MYCTSLRCRVLLLVLMLALSWSISRSAGTDQISGTVRNETRGLPTAGDSVLLLRPDADLQEVAHTATDERGQFRIRAPGPMDHYVVRVIHDHVAYDQRAIGGNTLAISVFDSARRVAGIHGTIEIFRAGTTASGLHVSDMYEIVNDSRPPFTLVGARTFAAYLPPNAKIDSVLAAGPGKIGVLISARAVAGEPGLFVVEFPLRPGANKFAFNYDLPYASHAKFQTRRMYSVQQLAVMLPHGMKFESSSGAFAELAAGNPNYQVTATKLLPAGSGPTFEIFGGGALLPIEAAKPSSPLAIPPNQLPRQTVVSPAAQPSLTNSRTWWPLSPLLAAAGALLATMSWIVWRARRGARPGATTPAPRQRAPRGPALLQALRQELSRLDAERARGTISAEEYASTKLALEKTLQGSAGAPG